MPLIMIEDKGYYYLRDRENKNGKREETTLAKFGKEKPSLYNPKLINGDAREVLKDKKARSVGLVVTSPPYFLLKEAPWGGDYDEYMSMLNGVWKRCYDLLDNSCRMVVNVGDEYTKVEEYGRNKAIPIHADIISSCEDIGFDYKGATIWIKVKTLRSSGGGAIIGSYPYPREFLHSYDYEYCLIFKKPGRGKRPSDEIKEASKVNKSDWKDWYQALWKIPGAKKNFHSAPFPTELPMRLTRLFSFVGEIVLDPFCGSGTTPLVAMRWGRKGVGIDVNDKYIKMSRKRIDGMKPNGEKHYRWVDEWEW